jgi:hypothetical protein
MRKQKTDSSDAKSSSEQSDLLINGLKKTILYYRELYKDLNEKLNECKNRDKLLSIKSDYNDPPTYLYSFTVSRAGGAIETQALKENELTKDHIDLLTGHWWNEYNKLPYKVKETLVEYILKEHYVSRN